MNKEQPEALQLPTLPFAVFDEFGQPCEDRVRDHFAAAFDELRAQIGQGEPTDEQIMATVQQKGFGFSQSRPLAQQWDQVCELIRAVVRERNTHPAPQKKPLTDEQIKDCLDAADQMYCPRDGDKEIFKARAIEAAHNIGEKK